MEYEDKKFIETIDLDEWEVQTDTGWSDIISLHKTVEYDVWHLKTENGLELYCADNHIIFDNDYNEIFVKDCIVGETKIITNDGISIITHLEKLDYSDNMYDLELDDENHRYWTNDILSHNTETIGLYLLWQAMFDKNKDILVTANKLEQAKEIINRIQFAYEHCPEFIRAGIAFGGYNKTSIEFDTGSRIVARATTTDAGRGLSPAIIYCDEFGFVKNRIQSEFYSAMLPALSTTKGKFFISSTPNDEFDKFADLWKGAENRIDYNGNEIPEGMPGNNGFYPVVFTWKAHPNKDDEWERRERAATNDDAKFDREHNLKFAGRSDTLLNTQTLQNLSTVTKNTQPLFKLGEVRFYHNIEYNKNYAISLDPSLGTGSDFAAIQVFQLPELIQVAEWQHNRTPVEEQIKIVSSISRFIDDKMKQLNSRNCEIYWSFENNGIGQRVIPIINNLPDDIIKATLISPTTKNFQLGFNTNRNKIVSCSILKKLCDKHLMSINSRLLVQQLFNYVESGGSYACPQGEHDDLISALLIIINIVEEVSKYDDSMHDVMNENTEEYIEPMPYIVVQK